MAFDTEKIRNIGRNILTGKQHIEAIVEKEQKGKDLPEETEDQRCVGGNVFQFSECSYFPEKQTNRNELFTVLRKPSFARTGDRCRQASKQM